MKLSLEEWLKLLTQVHNAEIEWLLLNSYALTEITDEKYALWMNGFCTLYTEITDESIRFCDWLWSEWRLLTQLRYTEITDNLFTSVIGSWNEWLLLTQ